MNNELPVMKITRLLSNHNRTNFDCGNIVLNAYFKERAMQDVKRKLCAIYVLSSAEDIIGFYALSIFSMKISEIPLIFGNIKITFESHKKTASIYYMLTASILLFIFCNCFYFIT
jgi:hypothetical protein